MFVFPVSLCRSAVILPTLMMNHHRKFLSILLERSRYKRFYRVLSIQVAEQKRKKAKRMTKTKSHSSKDVNDKNNKGETKLHRAVVSNKPAKIRKILQIPGVNPNAGCNFGWTPLAEACNKGYIGCVKELLRLPTGRTNKNEIKMG